MRIVFNDLIIDQLSQSSGVFSGENIHIGTSAIGKHNEGTGRISGSRTISVNNRSLVIDSDEYDFYQHETEQQSKS
ncbi:hypothetical protein A374_10103 [Fictibacillus macauensis ZFHKF-1]|uniref:Uncharacterized protein n=1 Tax=Fictibacillus macauensis ZFHKF-1 TaxID=1196324 RepID=I8AIM9_9BACL|nr:hypothetical protein [Fictibacillus macauensis]EIT85582.1 hypothetical protein A374_10103 [Fictibacillus macauensis ZFHKF-1]